MALSLTDAFHAHEALAKVGFHAQDVGLLLKLFTTTQFLVRFTRSAANEIGGHGTGCHWRKDVRKSFDEFGLDQLDRYIVRETLQSNLYFFFHFRLQCLENGPLLTL